MQPLLNKANLAYKKQPKQIWTLIGVLLSTATMGTTQGMAVKITTSVSSESRGESFARNLPKLRPFHRRVFLLRHGQTDWNMRGLMQGGGFDIELNENGKKQAELAAQELSEIPFGVIASSHLQRTIQTANHLYKDNNQQKPHEGVLVDARFGEMRFGDFEGTAIHGPEAEPEHKQRFKDMQQKMKNDIHLKWPGSDGECTQDVSERGKAALEQLLDTFPDEDNIAVVAHGRFNKVLLATLLWGDASRYSEMEQGNTCINVLDYNEDKETWSPVLLNYIDHAPTADAKKALNGQVQVQQQNSQRIEQQDSE